MKNDIKTGLHLKEGKFNKVAFLKLFENKPVLGTQAAGDRLIIEERLTVRPSKLAISNISDKLTDDERHRAIAGLNPQREYVIVSSNDPMYPVGTEVVLDWARAMDMIRIDARTGTPNLIEAAAAVVSLSFSDRQFLSKMKDIVIHEYLAVWPISIVCFYTVPKETTSTVGDVEVYAKKSKIIKPDTNIILPIS